MYSYMMRRLPLGQDVSLQPVSKCGDCSLNAVTGFSGSSGSGTRKQYNTGQQWTNNDSDGSWFIPRGFRVELVEDSNYNQRHRRRVTTVYDPNIHQIVNRPHHVFWLGISDQRTSEQKSRDAQVGNLQREAALASEEAEVAERLARSATVTAQELEEAKKAAAAREEVRSDIQSARAASDAAAAAESAMLSEQARQAAIQRVQAEAAMYSGGEQNSFVLPIAIGAGALLLIVALVARK